MSLVPVLVSVLLLAGLAVAVRVWSEQRARQAAAARAQQLQARVAELQEQVERAGEHEREWLAVLAHELRSPVGAVLGYAELVGDGALGHADDRVIDAVARMGRAAENILALLHGLEDIALLNDAEPDEPEDVDLDDLMQEAADRLRYDAESRNAGLAVLPAGLTVRTRRDDAARALCLALSAAVKISPGRSISLAAEATSTSAVEIGIAGSALTAELDDPAAQRTDQVLSGAGFRIALARSALARCNGTAEFRATADATDFVITLPTLRDA